MKSILFKSCLNCENYNKKYVIGKVDIAHRCLGCKNYNMWRPRRVDDEFIKTTVSESTVTTDENSVETTVSKSVTTIGSTGIETKVSKSNVTVDPNGVVTVSIKEWPVLSLNKDGIVKYIDFSEALKALKEGKEIAQKDKKGATIILCRTSLKLPKSIIEAPFFLKITNNSRIEVWEPSIEDIFAEDWYIVE